MNTRTIALFCVMIVGTMAQPACHLSRELNLDGIGAWPSVTQGVWFKDGNASVQGNNVTTEPYTWSINLCAKSNFSGCAATGHVAMHNAAGDCLEIYDSPVGLPEEDSGLTFTYRSSATMKSVSVVTRCNVGIPDGVLYMNRQPDDEFTNTATYDGVSDPDLLSSYDDVVLQYSSRQACRLNDKLCTLNEVHCRNRTLSCLGTPGVCSDATCIQLSKQPNPTTDPLGVNVRGELTVTDCRGATIPGLGTEDFVTKVDDRTILPGDPEGAALITDTGVTSNVKLLVSLALDQSASVVNTNKSALLKDSVLQFLESLYPAGATTVPLTSIFAFDGSEDIVTLQPSFSPDKAKLVAAANSLPADVGDAQSTNLYGAVDKVVRITESVARSLKETTDAGIAITYQQSIVVFSDGTDTASRYDRQASINRARLFTASNNTNIYFVDLSTSASDTTFAASISSPESYFKVEASDLAEVFKDIGRLLAISASKYSTGVCTAFRSTGYHGLFISLNDSKLGTKPSASPPLFWPFDSGSLQTGCTETTLQQAAAAAATNAQKGTKTSLPTLSRTQTAATVQDYFYVNTDGMESALVYVDSSANVQILLSSGDGTCNIVTKYCFDNNGTTRASLPAASMVETTTVSGLLSLGNGAPLAAGTTLMLQWTAKAVPTPNPTAPVTAAPDTSSDDSSSGPNIFIISIIIVGVIVLCLVIFYIVRAVRDKNKQKRQQTSPQPEPPSEANDAPYESAGPIEQELVSFQHLEENSRAVPLPMNYENDVNTFNEAYEPSQPNKESGRDTPLLYHAAQ